LLPNRSPVLRSATDSRPPDRPCAIDITAVGSGRPMMIHNLHAVGDASAGRGPATPVRGRSRPRHRALVRAGRAARWAASVAVVTLGGFAMSTHYGQIDDALPERVRSVGGSPPVDGPQSGFDNVLPTATAELRRIAHRGSGRHSRLPGYHRSEAGGARSTTGG
jgi:hypothetical protein